MENQNLKEFSQSLENFRDETNKSIDLLQKAIDKILQKENGPKKREFPKTFEEVLDVLKTASKGGRPDPLYLLWNWIVQGISNQRLLGGIEQETATLKCMLIAKAINMIDSSNDSSVHGLRFYLGFGGINHCDVDNCGSLFIPSILTFKSKIGAEHALKYFNNEWKEMFTNSK